MLDRIKNTGSYIWAILRGFVVASWGRIQSSTATFSSLGNDLFTGAQTDLVNLKNTLENLWKFTDEDKSTMALHLAAGLGKLGFTPLIIVITLSFALFKIFGGTICLFLGGDWLKLIRRFGGILKDFFVESFKLICRGCKNFATFISEFCANFANRINELCAKLISAINDCCAAITRNIGIFCSWLSAVLQNLWNGFLDFVSAACKAFKAFGNFILEKLGDFCSFAARAIKNLWNGFLDFVSAACKAFKAFGNFILEKLGDFCSFAARAIKNLWNGFLDFVSAACKAFKNIGRALLYTAHAIRHLGMGTTAACVHACKGVLFGVAALFFETGLAAPVSGFAKSIFIVEESLAAAVGSLLDGARGALISLGNAGSALMGYRLPVQPQRGQVQGRSDTASYSKWCRDGIHYFNENVASIGNGVLNAYTSNRNEIIGASSWSRARAEQNAIDATAVAVPEAETTNYNVTLR